MWVHTAARYNASLWTDLRQQKRQANQPRKVQAVQHAFIVTGTEHNLTTLKTDKTENQEKTKLKA